MRSVLLELLDPLRADWRACIYSAVALGLLLVWLHQGQRAFFALHLASTLVPGASPAEIEWWGTIYQFAAASLLFLAIPALLLKCAAGERLRDLGLGLGDRRFGLLVVVLGWLLIALPSGISAATMAEFRAEYPLAKLAASDAPRFLVYELAYGLLYYVAYESFFRGFVQLGLARRVGHLNAILIQTAITTLLHIGKPQGEIWSALAAGFLFGIIVVRTRSVWPLVLVHWGLGAVTDIACAHASGILS